MINILHSTLHHSLFDIFSKIGDKMKKEIEVVIPPDNIK